MSYQRSKVVPMPLSEEQRDSAETFHSGRPVAERACAGSGKSHNIKYTAINDSRNCVSIPFGRGLADDQRKFFAPYEHCSINNFHRYGLSMLKPGRNIDERKVERIALETAGEDGYRVSELVTLMKAEAYGMDWNHPTADTIALKYGFKPELADTAVEVLKKSDSDRKNVDFADMLRFPVQDGKQDIDKSRAIFLDEVQDYFPLAFVWLKECVAPAGSNVFMVGDPDRQTVMGFTGADPELFDTMARFYDCERKALTYNRRCAKAIVANAPHRGDMQALEDAPEGIVGMLNAGEIIEEVRDGQHNNNAVLSEANAPLVRLGMDLLSNKVPVQMRDAKIDKLILRYAFRYLDTRKVKLGEVTPKVRADVESFEQDGGDASEAKDVLRCIDALETYCLSEGIVKPKFIRRGGRWIPIHPIQQALYTLTSGKEGITLLTGHTAKGLEWDTCFYLPGSTKAPTQDWEIHQSNCLDHVIATRAKTEFYTLAVA